MSKLPKTVRIGAVDWKIRIEPNQFLWHNKDCYGETQIPEATILLNADLSPSQQKTTLMHEIFHAAWSQTTLAVVESTSEEDVIRGLEPLITDALQRPENERLRRFLFS